MGDKWNLVSGRLLMEGGFSWKVVPGVTLGARLSGGYSRTHQSVDVYSAPTEGKWGNWNVRVC